MTERRDDKALWSRQWELFHAAVERPATERQDFLAEACPDAELRSAVEDLLRVHEAGSGPLHEPLEIALGNEPHDTPSEQGTLLRRASDTLPAGRVLAERFEITGLLGQGGMGSVYEAHDRELDTPVALKMLRPEIAASSASHQRFLREIQLARQVTHPNVCRIFDLFQDEELSFLTMELLEGETLRRRIEENGPLSTESALPLVEQICAGLSAAHDVGIVHRDLKTANIMLVETGDSVRAVVTDFGLARSPAADAAGSDQLTVTGQVLGTPAYMAPEQLEGGEISRATDIYALGVVLFELVTGKLPFEGDTPYSIVARRLREEAPSPRNHLPDLDPGWERLILRCLERDPRERPQSPEEVAATLRGEAVSLRWSPRRRKRWIAAAAAIALLALLAFLVGPRLFIPDSPGPTDTVAFADRDWLLIADFDNRTGEEVLDGTLEAALERDLANSNFVNVASAERVGDSLRLMGRPIDTRVDASLAREVALRDGGIRAVVAGRVERLGSTYLLSVDLLNPADGVVLAGLSEEAAGQEALLPAVRVLSIRVRESLGEVLPTLEKSDESLSKVSTPSLRALQLYSRADRFFVEADGGGPDRDQAAEELLREAIIEDPGFASSHTHLAWAIFRQGRPSEEYLPHAERALELVERASVVERYFIRGSYYRMRAVSSGKRSDSEAALAQYQALLELDPRHQWATNNIFGLLRRLGRGLETSDFLLRLVEVRPNDFATLFKVAYSLVIYRGALDEARPYFQRALELQGDQPIEMSEADSFMELYPVHELWVRGDVEGVAREVDRIVGSLDGVAAEGRASLAREAAEYYFDLGMFEKAEELQTLHAFADRRQWTWKMALRRGEREVVRELTHWRSERADLGLLPDLAMDLAKLGYVADAEELLDRLPEGFDLVPGVVMGARGIIDFTRQRYPEVISRLEEAMPLLRQRERLGYYLFCARILSRAWEALGEPERGLEVLEEASRQKPRIVAGRYYWMLVQLRLAELYREVGRGEEALTIEDELRRYCAYADPDFPILQELEKRERLTPAPVG